MVAMLKKAWNFLKSFLETISEFMNGVINFILLAIVYFAGIAIVSIISKILGKHFLQIKKSGKKSNWIEHKVSRQPLESYYRTF